jgi:uncharacterized protein
MSQLCIAAMDGHTARVRQLLAQASAVAPSDRAEALVRAAARGHYSIVEALLEADADPDVLIPQGGALHCATLNNDLDVVRSLLQGGATPDLRDHCTYGRGWTALMYAASLGHLAIAHLLLSHGAGVNQSDRDGQTPLIIAANAGHTAMVLLLIEAGANTGSQDHYGNTALSYARNAKVASDELVLDRLP